MGGKNKVLADVFVDQAVSKRSESADQFKILFTETSVLCKVNAGTGELLNAVFRFIRIVRKHQEPESRDIERGERIHLPDEQPAIVRVVVHDRLRIVLVPVRTELFTQYDGERLPEDRYGRSVDHACQFISV